MTLARALTPDQLAATIPLVAAALPIRGSLASGGVEDGGTGERWPPAT